MSRLQQVLDDVREKTASAVKEAFSTNAFSGPMNPNIASGASFLPPMKVPGLRAPVEKTAEEFKLQGHTNFQGLAIAIENAKGSVRRGVNKDGTPWATKMQLPYGYFKGTKGADGDDVDVFVGPNKTAPHAFVVQQKTQDGKKYDEDKVFVGLRSVEETKRMFNAHYKNGDFLGPVKTVPMERLKGLLESGKKLVKISASSPTRGGFLLASDIPAFHAPSLRAPLEKQSDMLPDYAPSDEGQKFKKSKYAEPEKIRINNGDHAQYLLDKRKAQAEGGELSTEISDDLIVKESDISPTSPMGDLGGNPHRMQSWLANVPVNSLRAPLRKMGSLVPGSPQAARNVGKVPALGGATGPSIADIAKPKGMKFGGPLPGANKGSIGGYNPPKLT